MSTRPTPALNHWLDNAARRPLLTAAQELHLGRLVRAWQDHPAPCPARVERAGRRARDRIVEANVKLVARWSHKWAHLRDVGYDDVFSAGLIGLCRAAEKFDPERGYKFSTYAAMWVKSAVQKQALNKAVTVSIRSSNADLLGRIPKVERLLWQEKGRPATLRDLAEALEVEPDHLAQLIAAGWRRPLSLEARAADRSPLAETLAAGPVVDPEPYQRALEALTAIAPDDAAALALLAEGGKPSEVADLVGVSPAKLRKRLKIAREFLRELPEIKEALAA